MPELVISNTSPLFYLHRLRHLELLYKLYERIVVPAAVVQELAAGREEGHPVTDIASHSWIHVRPVQVPAVIRLITDLGAGEAEVLSLALEQPESLVIVDDKFAREVAKARKIRLTGTAGLLVKAKQAGLIPAVAPLLDELIHLNFRLSEPTMKAILKLARE
jgi:hypothetical protein